MAKPLAEWVDSNVAPYREKSIRWLSENHFFRDPMRPMYSHGSYFFSPADGIVLYQQTVQPDEPLVEIKGRTYTVRDAMRDPYYDEESLVIGIFMTFFDVHVNRVPYAGRLSYKQLDPLESFNRPMLEIEKSLLEDLRVDPQAADYLHYNQRVLNRVFAPALQYRYYILQIADYDVDSITPFDLKQNRPFAQNQRFGQIRYGSQVDLILPLTDRFDFTPLVDVGTHVEAGMDRLVAIREK